MNPKLSILICSLYQREKYLKRLEECLKPQIPKDGSVEVLVCRDDGELSIGSKRNKLLNESKGQWICMVDDDDLVDSQYVTKILKALETEPDCVGFSLVMTIDGKNPERSYHSIKYDSWFDKPNKDNPNKKDYFRNPNHLNPVKRELALLAGGYPNVSMCEDRVYSANLQPLLKTEVYIEEPIYFYLCRTFKEC